MSRSDSFGLGWERAGLAQVGDFERDRSEHVDEQQVRRARRVDRVESDVGEEFEEALVQGERAGATWTYAILAVPILLLPAVLGRRDDPVLRAATYVGATSVLLSLIGFLRWVFVVPPLAQSYVTGDPVTRAAVDAAWTAQHQFGGALLGEHLGQLLVIGWSVTLSVIILRTRVLPRWLGVTGLAVSTIYLLNQGDILATAVPGFPVWDLAHTSDVLFNCSLVVIIIAVIPWGHVWQRYVRAPGDPWR